MCTPGDAAASNTAAGELADALDDMFDNGELFLGSYKVLGSVHQRGGGQGLVQFALHLREDKPVAIKVRPVSCRCTQPVRARLCIRA